MIFFVAHNTRKVPLHDFQRWNSGNSMQFLHSSNKHPSQESSQWLWWPPYRCQLISFSFQVSGDSAQKKSPRTQRVFRMAQPRSRTLKKGQFWGNPMRQSAAMVRSSQSSLELLSGLFYRSVLGSFRLRSGILRWGSNLAGGVRATCVRNLNLDIFKTRMWHL